MPDKSRLEEATKTAGSVAHELNNLLTVININTEFLVATAGTDPTSAEELREIQRAAHRASMLARRLLAASRLEPFDPELVPTSKKRTPPGGSAKDKAAAARESAVAKTILVVEDESGLRSLVTRVLTLRGYRVLEAADGALALRLAASHVGEIDLVVTDIDMPNLGGRGMFEELKELSPDLNVLFMSGHPKAEVFPDAALAIEAPYLQKPFTGETLCDEVRSALGLTD